MTLEDNYGNISVSHLCNYIGSCSNLGYCLSPPSGCSNKFEVYNIYNIPLPIKDPNVAVKEMPNMVAEFKLESKLLAINLEKMKYILLTSAELESCTSQLHHYCDIRSPLYPINLSKLCIAALFLKNKDNVKAYCQTTVKPNFLLPMAIDIIQGLWVIASQKN